MMNFKKTLILLMYVYVLFAPSPSEIQQEEYSFFDEDITFNYQYVDNEETLPYMLFYPQSKIETKKPLIIWLHGYCERNVDERTFLANGLPAVMNNWSSEGFDAYVLCPQLLSGQWHFSNAKEQLLTLLNWFIPTYNIDTENIVIVGHSSGAQGALYMAHEMPEYFSKLVVLSGYYPNIEISEISIPTIGYVGLVPYGEYEHIAQYMNSSFLSVFGKENMFYVQTWHANVPYVVFNEDKDQNNRSDIIEWMFMPE